MFTSIRIKEKLESIKSIEINESYNKHDNNNGNNCMERVIKNYDNIIDTFLKYWKYFVFYKSNNNKYSRLFTTTIKNRIEHPCSFAYIHLKLQVTMENDQIESGFLNDYTVVVVTKSGYFYRYRVPINGGECKLLSEHSLRESNNYQEEHTTVYNKKKSDAKFKEQEEQQKNIKK